MSEEFYYIPPRAEAAFYLLWKHQKVFELEEIFLRIFIEELRPWIKKTEKIFRPKKWVMSKEDITQTLLCNILSCIRKRRISHPHRLLKQSIEMTKKEVIERNDNLIESLESVQEH